MSNLNKAMRIISQHTREYDPHFLVARQAASDLHSAGLLAPDLQIVRTVEELEELDLDTLLINEVGMVWDQWNWFADYTAGNENIFPLAIIATSAQVRAAREAMELDNV